jgi:predicted DNA-binding transcriptional regulator AlpA
MELINRKEACQLFGGQAKPIDASTLYRGIRQGRYPRPVKVGPGSSRWLRAEMIATPGAESFIKFPGAQRYTPIKPI